MVLVYDVWVDGSLLILHLSTSYVNMFVIVRDTFNINQRYIILPSLTTWITSDLY